jgi:uncharacterized linocin/CFP29 family protein
MEMDFVLNGQGHGDVASALMMNNFDTGALRPWIGNDGRSYVAITNAQGQPEAQPVGNAASLRKDDWILLDQAIVRAAKERLRAVADLRGAGLTFDIPNGMSKTILETETQSDISAAEISMDGMRQSDADRPLFDIGSLPLPIIHKDFNFSARQVMASRNGGSPLDTTTAELAARRVAEMAEQLLIGTAPSYSYGGGTVYGYTNFPQRLTSVMTTPTGTNGNVTVDEVLGMRQQSTDSFHYGPWVLYNSPAWDRFLDQDYSTAKGDNTLRDRLRIIQGISDVRTLDYLTGFQMVLVQMTSDVIREVMGMDITTVQWESKGGMQLNFKVMAIMVPQLRADFNGRTGIVHGTAP